MQKEVFVFCIISVMFSLLGVVLFKKEYADSKAGNTDTPVFFRIKDKTRLKKIWILLMIFLDLIAVVRLYFVGENILMVARAAALLTALWICAWWDLNLFLIPNKLLLISLVIRLVIFAAEALVQPDNLRYTLSRCFIAGIALLLSGILCRLVSSGSLGFGDIKLMTILGLYLGLEWTWNSMICSMLVIFIFSVFLLLTGKAKKDSSIPFAPAMLVGTWLSFIL